jgi:hypothetical protein
MTAVDRIGPPAMRARSIGFYSGWIPHRGLTGPAPWITVCATIFSFKAPFFFYAGTSPSCRCRRYPAASGADGRCSID